VWHGVGKQKTKTKTGSTPITQAISKNLISKK